MECSFSCEQSQHKEKIKPKLLSFQLSFNSYLIDFFRTQQTFSKLFYSSRYSQMHYDWLSILFQNKHMIHEFLKDIVSEQMSEGGAFKDDVDLRVEEINIRENSRMCPNCKTVMPRHKWKCINKECRVDRVSLSWIFVTITRKWVNW